MHGDLYILPGTPAGFEAGGDRIEADESQDKERVETDDWREQPHPERSTECHIQAADDEISESLTVSYQYRNHQEDWDDQRDMDRRPDEQDRERERRQEHLHPTQQMQPVRDRG